MSDAVWRSTFHDARPVSLEGTTLTLAVPNPLSRDRIAGTYESLVLECLADAAGEPLSLQVRVDGVEADVEEVADPLSSGVPGEDRAAEHAAGDPSAKPATESADEVVPGDPTPGDPDRYTFATFVAGPSNRFAHAAALAVAEKPGQNYNPLFIYGDAGLGKTHLLQAISHYISENYPHFTVRYVSSETFLSEFVDSVRAGEAEHFKRRYRDVNVLLVDDIQFIEGREETQVEFFHTFNALHQANRQIVLSSDRPPDAISKIENRLRSRFKMGLITDVQRPDLETRLAILRKKAERSPVDIPDEVLEFIADNIADNIRELEGALTRVTAYTSLVNEPLTLELTEQVLANELGERVARPLTPEVVLDATAAMYGFSVEELKGKSRQRPLTLARQVAMYVLRETTELSYPAIASAFGGRDHTTVMHAVDKIGNLMAERRQIFDQVTELITTVRGGK